MRTSAGIVGALERDAAEKNSKTIHGGPSQEGTQN